MSDSTKNHLRHFFPLDRLGDFSLFVLRRLYRDHCAQIAASLTYTSLLASVPFLIVSFSIIREFPVFPELVNNLQTAILQIITPDVGVEVQQHIQDLIRKGRGLPVFSFVALVITAVLMLYTLDDTLNRIWQVEYRRRTWFSLLVYLLVVVTGPILLGISLALTTYLVSRPEVLAGNTGFSWLTSMPWLVTFIAFTSLYRWMPNTHVRWPYAIAGGLLATLLFEIAKLGFALYIRWVPTYNLLYGTLAAIPLMLVWLYLSWLVVLVGAETTRCLATYLYGIDEADLTGRQLLGFFLRTRGGEATVDQICAWGYLGNRRVMRILQQLQDAGFIEKLAHDKFQLSEKARQMELEQLRRELVSQLKSIQN